MTVSEEQEAYTKQAMDFIGSLVPFKSMIENIQTGNTGAAVLDFLLDTCGFVVPGFGAAGKIGTVMKSGAPLIPKAMKMTWIAGKTVVTASNPLDGVVDLFKGGANAVCKLGTKAYSAVDKGIDRLKSLYGLSSIDPAFLLKRADIAKGVVDISRVAGQTENVKALFKEGKWYAFDEAANRPYGPPLENFIPDSSIALERTTFSDGSTAFANSPLFNENSHAIQRSLFTDVVVGDKVYRFDPARPTVLEALTSPTYNKELADFEDVCSIGNRAKRSPHPCFSKIIQNRRTRAEKQLQSIEHKRLHPSRAASGGIRKVVHERRVFTIVDNGNTQKLVPSPLTQPLLFRSTTKGSIINDQHFGLPSKQVDAQLESKTRVVRIDGIVHGIEDQRDARGFLVNYDHQNGGMKTYLVVESDAGLFYYCEYDTATVNNFVLKKLDFRFADSLDSGLIKQHGKLKDQYLKAVGQPINNHFVALPPLDSIYMDLVHYKDYTLQKIEDLKAKVALLTDEKKREFVLAVWNQGKGRNVEVAVQAIKVEPITKPPSFNLLSAADQNKFYAEAAKSKVDAQFEATGLGSANKVVANDPIDMRRQVLAEPVVIWSYKRIDSPEAADLILRTGAGNCDQVAWTAKKIIDESGGIAEIWQMPGHTFTVVGVPRGTITKTVDFSEPAFENAWVVDPWGGFSCPANLFTRRLDLEMMAWKTEGKMLLAPDSLDPNGPMVWESPTDAEWINDILNAEKTPMS